MTKYLCRVVQSVSLALMVSFAGSASAGDTASLSLLGFSPDGHLFAFEEYGIQDGSGFPYANRYYVDTTTDRYKEGTPIRVRIDRDNAEIKEARDQAAKESAKLGFARDLAEHQGFAAGTRSVSQLDGDPHVMKVLPRPIFPSPDKPITITLLERTFPAGSSCSGLEEQVKGFTLTLQVDGEEPRELHADTTVPESRQCPLGYSIHTIQTYYPPDGEAVVAVVIAVRRLGFEGPDHRFIAVTGKL